MQMKNGGWWGVNSHLDIIVIITYIVLEVKPNTNTRQQGPRQAE